LRRVRGLTYATARMEICCSRWYTWPSRPRGSVDPAACERSSQKISCSSSNWWSYAARAAERPSCAHSTHRDQSVHAIVITGTTASW